MPEGKKRLYKIKLTYTAVVEAENGLDAVDRARVATELEEGDPLPHLHVKATLIERKNQWPKEWGDAEPLKTEES